MSQFKDLIHNTTSSLVSDQLPEFVRNNYPTFVAFLEAYYDYLEQEGKLTYTAKNIPNYLDIDYVVENNLTDFITTFQQTYLSSIPAEILADKANLLKHIKTFYSSRGTQKSFSFLFRALYNEPVEIFNTGQQILRASDGKWYQPQVIRVLPISPTVSANNDPLGPLFVLSEDMLGEEIFQLPPTSEEWVSFEIFGQTSFASAVVEAAHVASTPNLNYYELTISNLTKSFLPGETIEGITGTGTSIFATVLGIIPGITILDRGNGYNVGDPVIITGGGGANAAAFVSDVSGGNLIDLGILDGGAGYQLYPNWLIDVTGSTTSDINATIFTIDTTGFLAPNSFSFIDTIPNSNANALAFMNTAVANTVSFVVYGNCGPIQLVHVTSGGHGFGTNPMISVTQNTVIGNGQYKLVDYGAIGTFRIVNGGLGYSIGDDIVVTSLSSRGVTGAGNVTSVDANGVITSTIVALPSISGYANVSPSSTIVRGFGTHFTTQLIANNASTPGSGTAIVINNQRRKVMTITNDTQLTVDTNFTVGSNNQVIRLFGYTPGGFGYETEDFPGGVSVTVRTLTGDGTAVIVPDGILGNDAELIPIGSVFGQIEHITMSNFGDHYDSQPTIDLSQSGDGTAIGVADFVAGQFQYPGYYLNEDGLLSSRRYLEDARTYNNYSYQIKSRALVNSYYNLVYQILNPVGANMLGVTRILISTGQRDVLATPDTFITTSSIFIDLNFVLNLSVLN